jgi:MOSC domain-containing protein YiiM
MKTESVNVGATRSINWEGKNYRTGIFKYPVNNAIQLGRTDVVGDKVVDRRYHGGVDKACYAFSSEEYAFWKPMYPHLSFDYGMFGENLTVSELDETRLLIGDTFRVGTALIQVSEPRQPCVKLNIRFDSKTAMKTFIARERCGAYFRVLEEGLVQKNDVFELIQTTTDSMSLNAVFRLLYGIGTKESAIHALNLKELGEAVKIDLKRIWKL